MNNRFNAPKLIIKSHKAASIDVEKLAYARLFIFYKMLTLASL